MAILAILSKVAILVKGDKTAILVKGDEMAILVILSKVVILGFQEAHLAPLRRLWTTLVHL